jgi:hypothetical protein
MTIYITSREPSVVQDSLNFKNDYMRHKTVNNSITDETRLRPIIHSVLFLLFFFLKTIQYLLSSARDEMFLYRIQEIIKIYFLDSFPDIIYLKQ